MIAMTSASLFLLPVINLSGGNIVAGGRAQMEALMFLLYLLYGEQSGCASGSLRYVTVYVRTIGLLLCAGLFVYLLVWLYEGT